MPARRTTMEINILEEGALVSAIECKEGEIIKNCTKALETQMEAVTKIGYATNGICENAVTEARTLQVRIAEYQLLKLKLEKLFDDKEETICLSQ